MTFLCHFCGEFCDNCSCKKRSRSEHDIYISKKRKLNENSYDVIYLCHICGDIKNCPCENDIEEGENGEEYNVERGGGGGGGANGLWRGWECGGDGGGGVDGHQFWRGWTGREGGGGVYQDREQGGGEGRRGDGEGGDSSTWTNITVTLGIFSR